MGVGLLLHAPLGPAGVLRVAPQGGVAHFEEHRAGGHRRGRGAAEQGLRVLAVSDHILQGTGLIVGVLLGLVDDQQVKALAQAALGGAGAELDAALALFQLDVLPAHGLNGFIGDLGLVQQVAQPLPGGPGGGGAVGGVQDALALLQAVQLPDGGDLVLAVAAGHGIAELGMHPQILLVAGKDVIQQQLLPLLGDAPGGVVQVDGVLAEGFGVGQHHGSGGRLTPQPCRGCLFSRPRHGGLGSSFA